MLSLCLGTRCRDKNWLVRTHAFAHTCNDMDLHSKVVRWSTRVATSALWPCFRKPSLNFCSCIHLTSPFPCLSGNWPMSERYFKLCMSATLYSSSRVVAICPPHHKFGQELMSGEAAKERATTAYTRVPSNSKLLASNLPNMETCSSIERHNDDIKTTCSVVAMWEIWHSLSGAPLT